MSPLDEEAKTMDLEARRYWLARLRQMARMTRADVERLDVPLNDPQAAQVKRRLEALLTMYDEGIRELEKGAEH
jgi:hypothetical protein